VAKIDNSRPNADEALCLTQQTRELPPRSRRILLGMNRPQFLRAAFVAVVAAGGLALMSSLGALQWPSVLAYSGLVVLSFGLLSVLVPPRWLGFSRRSHGLLVGILAGAALFAAGWFWPAGSFTTTSPATRLDAFLPAYNFHERHEITIRAPPERVRQALDQVSFADLGVVRTLGAIRSIAMGHVPAARGAQPASPTLPMVQMIESRRTNFFPLDDTPREFVFGLAGQPWNNVGVRLTPEEFRNWAPPDNVKIAANFLIEDAGNGRSRVITETRVAATDESARGKMARYWALIYPGSGMIRRSLLNAIRERAERR